MEFMLDTINLQEIAEYLKIVPVAGVTSNPSIVKKEGKIDFFQHMRTIRKMIGPASLHVQVVEQSVAGMLRDAEAILTEIDRDVFIKVPVNQAGMEVMRELKRQNIHVTATAIYTKFQGYLAIATGADYIAPYFNRMENMNMQPREAIQSLAEQIRISQSSTKILAASFKNVGQVNATFEAGAQAATLGTDIFAQAFAVPAIQQAVDTFRSDWESIFGSGTSVANH